MSELTHFITDMVIILLYVCNLISIYALRIKITYLEQQIDRQTERSDT